MNASTMSHWLDFDDATDVWRHNLQGKSIAAIAAWFDVSQSQVDAVLKGRIHPGSLRAALQSILV
ncbi:hypothetical protein DEM26_08845 [Thioclava sp. NG1]|uniref:hypothetical protein n=1 Tax=Thioclava sp. NG1 TaxID=2182426 RepID=UPI000D6124BC|nr:hypothetical protein [Thioclava sp. NG1]PWE50047.1 hypothetical protein DEM26_08845 [Thioclava sp. NG1]